MGVRLSSIRDTPQCGQTRQKESRYIGVLGLGIMHDDEPAENAILRIRDMEIRC